MREKKGWSGRGRWGGGDFGSDPSIEAEMKHNKIYRVNEQWKCSCYILCNLSLYEIDWLLIQWSLVF